MKSLRQQQYERALAGEVDPRDFVELYRTLIMEEDRARFWQGAEHQAREEVERLRDQLKFMTLYRDNALALYRSANVRAWIAGDHSTHPEELE